MMENTDLKIVPTEMVKKESFESIATTDAVANLIIIDEPTASNKSDAHSIPDNHDSINAENATASASASASASDVEPVVNSCCRTYTFNWRNWIGFMKN